MIAQISRMYMIENLRNYGVLFGNLFTPFLFIFISWIIKMSFAGSEETLFFMIKGQFMPISILLLIFSFAFSSATIYLADLKAERTFSWIQRTDATPLKYYLGMGIGVFTLMNTYLILLLIGYRLLVDISLASMTMIVLVSNFVLLALYPLSFILAGLFRNGKVAQSMLVPIMLIFMFSVTMTTMFLSLAGKNPHDYFVFLSWNPMLYLNDIVQFNLDLIQQTWLPQYQYFMILTVLSFLLAIVARKVYSIR
ncbi:ABC transporter permease [Lysinibacillus sp. NPDC096418]|uniref:ABC transporter permease n=1 Tax=Lysinibacillus sp. NPDC096418 TaxID=3364138 RepID=UPI00381B1294